MDKNNRHSTQDNKDVKQLLTETMLEDMKVIPKELFRHADGKDCGKRQNRVKANEEKPTAKRQNRKLR